ncbi:conserved oligomeric Golgi complex subunit 7-like [Ostrinia nubilalis]|uniref:conserved oligomeric Golgi complex subunit 7-like n=1 Tax=Ostrinia nubilalis TaxID=29057 RepID=UPI00308251B6
MDLKTFGEDDFDPKKWINKAWSSSGNQEKDIFVNNTVTRLQLYMKQLTNSLDETTTQIVTSIPRVLQDASSLQLEGALLQQRLLSLEQMVRDVQEQTGHSIESLQRTDQLKSRLENAASTLREADKWAALAAWLEDVLEAGVPTGSNELQELAGRVAAMTASLEVLSEAPDYESKRLQLETLYNRLEAAITPPFIEALTQMDADRTSVYVSLLTGMSRGAPARRCWRRAAAARLVAGWRRLEAHSSPALTHLLAADANKQASVVWYNFLCILQVEWLTNVLKADTPLGELIRLYTDLLLSLEPPPTKVASASFKLCSTPEEGINLLTDLRRDIDEFITFIRNVIDAPRPNKEILLPATLREFGRAAYAPLRELLPSYTELQGRMLLEKLSDPQLQQEDLLEQSRALLSIAERCDDWLATAYSKAKKIAGIAVYPYYLPAVDNFFTALSNLISSHSRTIETSFLESAGRGRGSGVLCAAFPAALALEAAAAAALSAAAAGHARESKDEGKYCGDIYTNIIKLKSLFVYLNALISGTTGLI